MKKVKDFIYKNKMLKNGDTVIVGVSGGADSICLLDILISLNMNLEIIVVHVHHGIRGTEADLDMDYVKSFAKEKNLIFNGFYFDVNNYAKENNLSSEEAGRILRYESFNKVAKEYRDSKIAVAHNLNDSCETFLLNLFRGTGIKGLSGIPAKRDNIIRPLLNVSREEIEEYLSERNIPYKVDSTNETMDYTRNKIRNELLPYVRDNINEKAFEHIINASSMVLEAEEYLENETEKLYNDITRKSGGNIIIEYKGIENDILFKRIIRKSIEEISGKLKDISYKNIEDIRSLKDKEVGKRVIIAYNITAYKNYDNIEIGHKDNILENEELCIDFEVKDDLFINNIRFTYVEKEYVDLRENLYTKYMDYGILKDNLSIRNRRSGDFMVVNSLGGKKKLKDILIDLKIPKEERDKLVLLTKGSEVLWIVGHRMSESCKVKKETKNIVKVEYIT